MSDFVESPGTRKRASKACTACRQVKLRCDTNSKFPGPCSRCKSTGRMCKVDPSFKRTSTRHQLEQVTSQLADLRHRVERPSQNFAVPSRGINDDGSPDEQFQTPDTLRLPDDSTHRLTPSYDSPTSRDDMFGLRTTKLEEISPARLGNADITPVQIQSLFCFFVEHQYDYLPALDTRLSLNTIQNSHPLLFWTIIVTASQYHHTYHGIASSSKKAYHELLAKSLVKAPLPLSSIQAVLILCYWPFPCLKQIFDPSWNFFGIALNAARFLALNTSAENLSFKVIQQDFPVRARVWLSCFHVGTILALHWGVSLPISSISDLQQIKHFIEECTIPRVFRDQLKTHHEIAQYRTFLESGKSFGVTLSASRLFEANIGKIGHSSASHLDSASEICQLRAKISLYATLLILARSETSQSQTTIDDIAKSTTLITISGLHAASRLIFVFSSLCEKVVADTGHIFATDAQSMESIPLLCVPKQYHTAVFIATLFLITFCIFKNEISQEDRTMAENMVKTSYQLLDRLSIRPNDEVARAVAVVKTVCTAGSWDMVVTNRECASLWFDACRRAGDLRGRDAREKFPDALATVNQSDDDKDVPITAVGTDLVPSDSGLDEWLTLPEFSVMDWSSGHYDVFGSIASPY